MYVKWMITQELNCLYFPVAYKNSATLSRKVTFHFGHWQRELEVRFKEELPENTFGLSINIIRDLFIPDDLNYDIYLKENHVHVGPVILYLVSKRMLRDLDALRERIENTTPFNGLILLSTPSHIDMDDKKITGYYFYPGSHQTEASWKEGTFSYPDVIFKRVPIPTEVNNDLYETLGGRLFNSTFFDKWDMWQWLAPHKTIKNHLPHTQQIHALDSIIEMLEMYPSVYLKPKHGSQGAGIIEVKKKKGSFQITDDSNTITHTDTLAKHPVIKKVMKKKKKYLIQQGVPVSHDSRNIDFRVYMQKDHTERWTCSGMIARFSKPGSITTNLRNLDYLLHGKEALKILFNSNDTAQLEQEIIAICKNACKHLDEHGCFADIAIDFIIDHNQHVWLLEMNKRYAYKSFSILEEEALFRKVIRTPFQYARSLAGFPNSKSNKK
ncbi:YheC/YheD family protein [Bacillus sp. FSL W7-1360]